VKVGDLVKHKGQPQLGVVLKLEGPLKQRVVFAWLHRSEPGMTWTHIANLEVVSESR
jgi:hypothetical protein